MIRWQVYEAAQQAIARARKGEGPTLLELNTYRITGHSRRDPRVVSAGTGKEGRKGKRTDQKVRQISDRGKTLPRKLNWMKFSKEWTKKSKSPWKTRCRRPDPKPEAALEDMFVELKIMKKMTIAEALREGIRQEMRKDERVFCIGEDIAIPGGWGGAVHGNPRTRRGIRRPDDEYPDFRSRTVRRGTGARP